MAVGFIGGVAGDEDAGPVRARRAGRRVLDVSGFIEVDEGGKDAGVRGVADGHEEAGGGDVAFGAGSDVADADRLDRLVAEDVGGFGVEEGELALVEIGDERKVIVFGEVNIIEVAVLDPSGGGSKNSCVTLALALMIAGAESGIIDEDFLGEVERMEIGWGAAVSDEDIGERDRFFPMAEHRLDGLRALVSEEEVEDGAHEESPGEEVT